MPDIRQLKQFIAVVESGGIRQAARQIHLSPASISRSVRMLEEKFSIKLFETRGKNLCLTVSGEYLLEEARKLIAGFDAIAPKLEQVTDIGTGSLRVGLAPAVADLLMPAVTSRLINENPSIRISTTIDTAAGLAVRLKNNELDLVVALENVLSANDNQILSRVYKSTPIWLVRKGHPLLEIKKPKMEDIAQYPLVTQHLEQYYSERVQEVLRTAGLSGSRILPISNCNNFRLLYDLVEQTDAVLMAALLNFKSQVSAKKLRRLRLPLDLPPIWFAAACPILSSPSPLASRYISYMIEEAATVVEKYGAE
jgi:DNA-binding transcriptional LysR family regulator